MHKSDKIAILAILDGWGMGPSDNTNAIHLAHTPVFDNLRSKFPFTELSASGTDVGLENHQTSGSETGHMNIGAGRIVKQDSRKISESINTGTFFHNPALVGAISHVKKNKSNLHLMGLLGNEDSPHMNPYHLEAILLLAKNSNLRNVFIHFFTDGRDAFPESAIEHIQDWENTCRKIGIGKIATLVGRFWAMDRSKNWDRLKIAYNLLVNGKGTKFRSPRLAIEHNYAKNITDEYIKPSLICSSSNKSVRISNDDSVIFFNLRSDRARQFTKLFVLEQSQEIDLPNPRLKNLFFVAMTDFGPDLPIHTAFHGHALNGTLPIALQKRSQLYIAETEKFAHISYFMNGGYPDSIAGEERIMIPSPVVKSYAEMPQMSAEEITSKIANYIKKNVYNFIAVNFANADMVGHTGDMKAAIRSVEIVDRCIGKIFKEVEKQGGSLFITADHGNADCMWDKKAKRPMTFHTKNPVPFIACEKKLLGRRLKSGGILANVVPTLCDIMNEDKLPEMKSNSLV